MVIIGDLIVGIKTYSKDKNTDDFLTFTASLGFLPGHTHLTRDANCLDHIHLITLLPATTIV